MSMLKEMTWEKLGITSFIMIYCGMYYSMFASLISLSYIILFFCFAYSLIKYRRLQHKDFLCLGMLFVVYSFFSSLWSLDYDYTIKQVFVLIKVFFIAYILSNSLREKGQIEWYIKVLMFSSIVYGLIYISQVDFSMLGSDRLTASMDEDLDLPNLNLVSIPVAFSFIYFFYSYIREKKIMHIIYALISLIIVMLLGSRKSILSICLGILFILFKTRGQKKIQILLFCVLFLLLVPLFIPTDYLQFVYDRLWNLVYINQDILLDDSDIIRKNLIESGINYFLNSPIIGFGYYNFSKLYLADFGQSIYSHNNFIEVAVGGGVIGCLLYYLFYITIFRNLGGKHYKFDLYYIVFILVLIELFNHTGIVLLQDRYTWIFIVLVYCYAKTRKLKEVRK